MICALVLRYDIVNDVYLKIIFKGFYLNLICKFAEEVLLVSIYLFTSTEIQIL